MMRELADNILDIAQNSIAAGASLVEIDIVVSHAQDTVSLAFIDNGCGMSEDMVRAVCDPFTTTRKTRKVGLGLPLLKMTAQATGGEMSIASKMGEGTLVLMNPQTDFRFAFDYDGKTFVLDTREIREAVAPIPLDHPEISAWIRDCLKQNIDELHGGLFS